MNKTNVQLNLHNPNPTGRPVITPADKIQAQLETYEMQRRLAVAIVSGTRPKQLKFSERLKFRNQAINLAKKEAA